VSPALLLLLLAAPAAEVQPAQARPGDAVLVTVTGAGAAPAGTLLGRPLRFYAAGPDRWQAVAPLPTEAAPGPVVLALDAAGEQVPGALEVLPADFRSTTLSVPPRFLEPPASAKKRIAADGDALGEAYGQPFGPPRYQGAMARPSQAEVSGRYGDQRVYNGKVSGAHYGLDLAEPAGAPVAASADGQVVLARDCYMSGWTTVVWHGAAVYSVYLHQSKVEVKPGQQVGKGQRIGRVGSTGRSTGPHLHWGVKVDGLWVDPDSLVRLEVGEGPATPPVASEAAPPSSPQPAAP
jgi:murein DD-endopeptidase MepM/ murein hydrolase activator NlpD